MWRGLLCGGDVTLIISSYRRGDYELGVEEYVRANETQLCFLLTRA